MWLVEHRSCQSNDVQDFKLNTGSERFECTHITSRKKQVHVPINVLGIMYKDICFLKFENIYFKN